MESGIMHIFFIKMSGKIQTLTKWMMTHICYQACQKNALHYTNNKECGSALSTKETI